jgi:uncharacterized protein YkwD
MNRKNIFMIALLFTITMGVPSGAQESSWKDEYYERYTHETFARYEPAQQRIDMKRIDYALLHAAIVYATNVERARQGVPPLKHSPALERAAWGHSIDMVKSNFFSHESPTPGRRTMVQRLAREGVVNARSAENIAYSFGIEYEAGRGVFSPQQNGGYFSYEYRGTPIENHTYLGLARAALKGWMNSPGHRKNILNPGYAYMGAGAAHYRNPGFHNMDNFKLTQNFSSIRGD